MSGLRKNLMVMTFFSTSGRRTFCSILLLVIAPLPLLAEDWDRRRREMVETIAAHGMKNELVLEVFRETPRHLFVPEGGRGMAYADRPVPIGYGQTISQPFIVAYMTDLAKPNPDDKVLEIGTGSGYQAAILSPLVKEVYTIEIVEALAKQATERLKEYGNVHVKAADGYFGWPANAPFDAIIVTAAAEHIPPPLVEQLKPGGRMVIPVGTPFRVQQLMLVEKSADGTLKTQAMMPVAFVPFTRAN